MEYNPLPTTVKQNKTCRFFRQPNGCGYGQRCKFSHDVPNPRMPGITNGKQRTRKLPPAMDFPMPNQAEHRSNPEAELPRQAPLVNGLYKPKNTSIPHTTLPQRVRMQSRNKEKPTPEVKRTEPISETRTMGDGTVSVTYGPGFSITKITPIFTTTSTVLLGDLPPNSTATDVAALVKKITDINILTRFIRVQQVGDALEATVRFREAVEAQTSSSALNGHHHSGARLSCRLLESASNSTDTVKIFCSWFLPSKFAIIHFPSPESADAAVKSNLKVRRSHPKYAILPPKAFRYTMQYSVRLTGLDVETTEADLMLLFPSQSSLKLYPPRYNEPLYEITAMIESLFVKHSGTSIDFEVISRPEEQRQRAVATFADTSIGEKLFNELRAEKMGFLGGVTLDMKILFTSKFRVTKDVYQVISKHVRQIVDNGKTVKQKTWERENSPVWITLTGPERASLATTKLAILKLTRGSVVRDDEGQAMWDDKLNFPAAREALKKAASSEHVHIYCDSRTRTVRIYGPPELCVRAKDPLFQAYRMYLDSLIHPLMLRFPRYTTEVTMQERIEHIVSIHGAEKVSVDALRGTITVRCMSNEVTALKRIVTGSQQQNRTEDGDCAVCLCDPEDPIFTGCGHRYCKSCFEDSIRADRESRKFPIRCLGPSKDFSSLQCNTPLDLAFILRTQTDSNFDALAEAALTGYIQNHPDELYYCPTPDCTSIFAVTQAPKPSEDPITRTCPQCLVTSCCSCRTPSHPTQTCEDNMMTEEQKHAAWKTKNNIKSCPKCGIDVEKIDGCHHITCKCGTHFCWLCGDEYHPGVIYDHMAKCTGPRTETRPTETPQILTGTDRGLIFGQLEEPNRQRMDFPGLRLHNPQPGNLYERARPTEGHPLPYPQFRPFEPQAPPPRARPYRVRTPPPEPQNRGWGCSIM